MTHEEAVQKRQDRLNRRPEFDEEWWDAEIERVIEHFPERGYVMVDASDTKALAFFRAKRFPVIEEPVPDDEPTIYFRVKF